MGHGKTIQEAIQGVKTIEVRPMASTWKKGHQLQANGTCQQLASSQKHVQQDAKAITKKGITVTPLIQMKSL